MKNEQELLDECLTRLLAELPFTHPRRGWVGRMQAAQWAGRPISTENLIRLQGLLDSLECGLREGAGLGRGAQ